MYFIFVLNLDGFDNNVYFLFNLYCFIIVEGVFVLKKFCCYSFVFICVVLIIFFLYFDELFFYELDIIYKMIRNK